MIACRNSRPDSSAPRAAVATGSYQVTCSVRGVPHDSTSGLRVLEDERDALARSDADAEDALAGFA